MSIVLDLPFRTDLQAESNQNPDHVAVDKTVIQLDDEKYWLYAAVDPETNELLNTKLELPRTNVLTHAFFAEFREKHDVENSVFLIDGTAPLKDACQRHGFDFRYEKHGNRNSVGTCLSRYNTTNYQFSNFFCNAKADTANDWLKSFSFAWNQLI